MRIIVVGNEAVNLEHVTYCWYDPEVPRLRLWTTGVDDGPPTLDVEGHEASSVWRFLQNSSVWWHPGAYEYKSEGENDE